MRIVMIGMILALLGGTGSAESIDKRYATNKNCQACHRAISHQWESSRHAHSHFTKNQLYDRTLEYLASRDLLRTKEELVVECSKCHNPRIGKRRIGKTDKLKLLLDLGKEEVEKVLNTETMQNGINCIVCHNVKEVHWDANGSKRGYDAVTFGPQGVMYGPFKGAKSPYHKTEYNPIFTEDPNKLCFACHYSDVNAHGVKVYATGEEYHTVEGERLRCIDCHMSTKKEGVASNYAEQGGSAQQRQVRDHLFASVDNSKMYKKYLKLSSTVEGTTVHIRIQNDTPHKVPTGYGLRVLELLVRFIGSNEKVLGEKKRGFEAHWLDEKGKPTIPHLAHSILKDNRIPAGESVEITEAIPSGTRFINYRLMYRQISEKMAQKLGIDDPFFTQAFLLHNGLIELPAK